MSTLARDHRPIYIQVAETLRARVISGYYEDRIDGELKLVEEFDVSRRTIQQALEILVSEGLLTRQQGTGTFVNRRGVEKRYRAIASITDGIIGQGLKAGYRILASGREAATAEAQAFFGLDAGDETYRHRRLVLAAERPVAVASTVLDLRLLPDLELTHLDEGLYGMIRRRYGRTIVRAEDSYRPVLASAEIAELLGVAAGSPVFLAIRRAYDQTGTPIELSEFTMIPVPIEISIRQVGGDHADEPGPADPWTYKVGFGDFGETRHAPRGRRRR